MKQGLTRRELEVTDKSEIVEILEKSKVLYLGMADGDEPYVVPMNFGYTLEEDQLTIYLHGATQGRKLDVLRKNPKVFFTMDCDRQPFEGKVACQYGLAYASIMGQGVAEIVEDVPEKEYGLSVLMKTQTGQDFQFNERLVSIVSVIKIQVSSYTAKRRPLPAVLQE